jgi:y4mF family transcriptional regulator
LPVCGYCAYYIPFLLKTGNKVPLHMKAEEIGKKIKERRNFLQIKQEDLADIADISERTLREIEKGAANPELKSLLKICEVLGMEIKVAVIT